MTHDPYTATPTTGRAGVVTTGGIGRVELRAGVSLPEQWDVWSPTEPAWADERARGWVRQRQVASPEDSVAVSDAVTIQWVQDRGGDSVTVSDSVGIAT